jgi:hypothetical protein
MINEVRLHVFLAQPVIGNEKDTNLDIMQSKMIVRTGLTIGKM